MLKGVLWKNKHCSSFSLFYICFQLSNNFLFDLYLFFTYLAFFVDTLPNQIQTRTALK